MCIISAIGLLSLLKHWQIITMVILSFLVPIIFYIRIIIVYPHNEQLEKIEWVLRNTNASDYVYDGDIYFNLYRKDIDYFWYSTEPAKGGLGTYQKLKPYSYDIYESISKFEPKIISNLFIEDMSNPIIQSNYNKSDKYPDLYIRTRE
jgi:hypothetical protein